LFYLRRNTLGVLHCRKRRDWLLHYHSDRINRRLRINQLRGRANNGTRDTKLPSRSNPQRPVPWTGHDRPLTTKKGDCLTRTLSLPGPKHSTVTKQQTRCPTSTFIIFLRTKPRPQAELMLPKILSARLSCGVRNPENRSERGRMEDQGVAPHVTGRAIDGLQPIPSTAQTYWRPTVGAVHLSYGHRVVRTEFRWSRGLR